MLTNNPFAEGQFEVKDNAGRKNQVLVWESWAVTYWADHPVKELRIVDVR